MPGANARDVSEFRRRRKLRMIEYLGGKCLDCGLQFPPFVYDFDHRDPAQKSFTVSNSGSTISWERIVVELDKCDLVCSNCHRMRTHVQRCPGCEFCSTRAS